MESSVCDLFDELTGSDDKDWDGAFDGPMSDFLNSLENVSCQELFGNVDVQNSASESISSVQLESDFLEQAFAASNVDPTITEADTVISDKLAVIEKNNGALQCHDTTEYNLDNTLDDLGVTRSMAPQDDVGNIATPTHTEKAIQVIDTKKSFTGTESTGKVVTEVEICSESTITLPIANNPTQQTHIKKLTTRTLNEARKAPYSKTKVVLVRHKESNVASTCPIVVMRPNNQNQPRDLVTDKCTIIRNPSVQKLGQDAGPQTLVLRGLRVSSYGTIFAKLNQYFEEDTFKPVLYTMSDVYYTMACIYPLRHASLKIRKDLSYLIQRDFKPKEVGLFCPLITTK